MTLSPKQIAALKFMRDNRIHRARWLPEGNPINATHMELGSSHKRKRVHRDDLDAIRPFYDIGPYGNRMFVPNEAGLSALAQGADDE